MVKLLTISTLFGYFTMCGQSAAVSAGGDGTGLGGSVAFSVGQAAYHTTTGPGGSAAQGVQHAWEIFLLSTSTPEEKLFLTVYPNPTAGKLLLHREHELPLSFAVFDQSGKRVAAGETAAASNAEIDFSTLPQGTYILKLTGEDKAEHTFKIIKK